MESNVIISDTHYSMNLLLIGKTYMRLKDKDKAIFYLTKARDYPAASPEDVEVTCLKIVF